jgi:hypothetical protein
MALRGAKGNEDRDLWGGLQPERLPTKRVFNPTWASAFYCLRLVLSASSE